MQEHDYMKLAKQWMHGKRKGSKRKAWEHPQDVVILLKQIPALDNRGEIIGIGWLHDVLEDGICIDRPVSRADLAVSGVPKHVRTCVEWLTHDEKTTKEFYLHRLREAPVEARIVKCADRIANLHEGRYTFGDKWFIKYTRLTAQGVMPLIETLPPSASTFLGARLIEHAETSRILEEYRRERR